MKKNVENKLNFSFTFRFVQYCKQFYFYHFFPVVGSRRRRSCELLHDFKSIEHPIVRLWPNTYLRKKIRQHPFCNRSSINRRVWRVQAAFNFQVSAGAYKERKCEIIEEKKKDQTNYWRNELLSAFEVAACKAFPLLFSFFSFQLIHCYYHFLQISWNYMNENEWLLFILFYCSFHIFYC